MEYYPLHDYYFITIHYSHWQDDCQWPTASPHNAVKMAEAMATSTNVSDGTGDQQLRRGKLDLLTFLWVLFQVRPGSGGQSPPRVRLAMAMSASAVWNP
jgi:hypothetical protein